MKNIDNNYLYFQFDYIAYAVPDELKLNREDFVKLYE